MTRVLTVEGLSKRFTIHHLDAALAPLSEVSFTLEAGQFLLLRGPNGAGKSTLLRTIYRSCRPTSGRILLETATGPVDLARAADVDIARLRQSELGFVTQFLMPRPRVSAEALVAEPLRLAGMEAGQALDEARRWLATFGVKPELWPAYPTTFSGGEQQKVNLARALTLPRRLLLLDEPTASLDQGARAALVDRLAALKAAGTAMIGVFHHAGDVDTLIDGTLALAGVAEERSEADVAV